MTTNRNWEDVKRWGRLLALLPQRPWEFYGRVEGYAQLRLERLVAERLFGKPPQYETVDWETASVELEEHFGNVANILEEPALNEIEDYIRNVADATRYENPGFPGWGADSIIARCCYLACRLTKPDIVVHTGVSYGVTSADILKALEQNRRGVLHNVDLPPLRRNFDRFWGIAVPSQLKSRWRLYRGSSNQILPKILKETEMVDVFVRDSCSTYRCMKQEFRIVWPYLRTGGIVIHNQVEWNRAFSELLQQSPAFWRVIRDYDRRPPFDNTPGEAMFGIAVK